MKYQATMTTRGRVTIPIETRRRLGLKAGDTVEFEVDAKGVLMKVARSKKRT